MKFKMNDSDWEIKEISNAEMNVIASSDKRETFTHGTTQYDCNTIFINEETVNKKKTLYHELMHCYKSCFICFYELNNQDEDFWCELSANSHDIIHKIVEDYFTTNVVLESPTNIDGKRIIKEVKRRKQC